MKQPYMHILDQAHLAILYQRYAPKMLDYIYKKVFSFQDAEDILTDVFIAALESTTFAALTEQEQQAWLWKVARNKVIDSYRRRHRTQWENLHEQIIEDDQPDPEQVSIQQEEQVNLNLLIKRLSPLQQYVLSLRFGENLRCNQIAARVGKRESSIRALLSRALKLLRHHYHEQEEGGSSHGIIR